MLNTKEEFEDADILVLNAGGEQLATQPVTKPARRFSLPKLPQFRDDGQRRAFQGILRFLALILIVTIVARGTAGATMARVRTQAPFSGEITQMVTANGTVETAYSSTIELPPGLVIERVLVVPGQNVQVGDAIAQLDTSGLAEQLEREQLKLDELNLNRRRMERGEPHDSSALINAQNALAWAEQDYETTRLAGEAAVARAQSDLDAAKTNAALSEDEQDPNIQSVESAERALQDAIATADANLQAAARRVETARVNLESAQKADGQARQSAADTAAQNALDAEALRLDIQNQQQLVEKIAAYQSDGIIKSELTGTVLQVAEAGVTKDGVPVAQITDNESGYRARASIHKDEAKGLAPGTAAEISSTQGYYQTEIQQGAVLLSLSEPDATGMVEALFQLPDGNWQHGGNVTVNIIQHRENHSMCVPLTALHQGSQGYYVFVMESTRGIMGAENVLHTVPVEVLARSGEHAAVSGALGNSAQVVVWSSKPLASNNKVRVETA